MQRKILLKKAMLILAVLFILGIGLAASSQTVESSDAGAAKMGPLHDSDGGRYLPSSGGCDGAPGPC